MTESTLNHEGKRLSGRCGVPGDHWVGCHDCSDLGGPGIKSGGGDLHENINTDMPK